MKFAITILIAWIFLSFNLAAQFPVFRPGWSSGPGLNQTTETIPKRYVGKHRSLLKVQLSYRGRGQWQSFRNFRFSQYHGMLLVPKYLRATPEFHWWSTGYTAIYTCVDLPTYGDELAAILCSVWDQGKQVCRVVKLVFWPDGRVDQTFFGPPSKKNAIWVAGSYVDRMLYVLDFQTATIIRFLDQDNDGNPETLDPQFSISVLGQPKLDEAEVFFSGSFIPLPSFSRTGSEVIRLDSTFQSCTGSFMWIVETCVSGFRLNVFGGFGDWRRRFEFSDCWLYANQDRVFITGPGEMDFVMEAQLPDGSTRIISSNLQIAKKKWSLVVELKEKLLAGWKVRVKSLQSDRASSAWGIVSKKMGAALFPPTNWRLPVGAVVELKGSNIPPHVGGILVDVRGKFYSIKIEHTDGHGVRFKIPPIALPIPKNNIFHNEIATFYLVDLKSGERVSHELRICLAPARPKKPKKD